MPCNIGPTRKRYSISNDGSRAEAMAASSSWFPLGPGHTRAMVVLITVLCAPAVLANGGSLRLDREPLGPYVVSAWTEPAPPRTGRLDISVAVMKPETGAPVLDGEVRVRAQSVDSPGLPSIVVLGLGNGGNALLHHGEVALPRPGLWRLTILFGGPGGSGEADFALDVRQRAFWPWIIAVVAGLLFTAYLIGRQRRNGMPIARPRGT